MPAYMMVAVKMHDRDKFLAGYAPAAAKLVKEHGGKYLFGAPGAQLLEGTLEGYSSVLVSEWPTKEHALAFWNSREYQEEIIPLREGICDCEVILTDTI